MLFLSFIQALSARTDDKGATMVEYGLLVALIAIIVAVGAAALGTELSALFTSVSTKV